MLKTCSYHLNHFWKMVAWFYRIVVQQRPCDYAPSETHSKCHTAAYFLEPCQHM